MDTVALTQNLPTMTEASLVPQLNTGWEWGRIMEKALYPVPQMTPTPCENPGKSFLF